MVSAPRQRLRPGDPGWDAYADLCSRHGATCPPPRFVHSAKPSAFYADIAQRTEGPRLDLFARQVHPGWDGWGDEYEGTPMDWTPCPTPT